MPNYRGTYQHITHHSSLIAHLNIFHSTPFFTASVLRCTSILKKRFEICFFTVFSETNNRSAICWLDNPSLISFKTSYSRLLIPNCSSTFKGSGKPVSFATGADDASVIFSPGWLLYL